MTGTEGRTATGLFAGVGRGVAVATGDVVRAGVAGAVEEAVGVTTGGDARTGGEGAGLL
jgi:hypothetical protein